MDRNKLSLTIVTALAASQLLRECLDEVRETPFYKQGLKAAVNKVENELKKTCEGPIADLWQIDDEVMQLIIRSIETTVKEMASLDPKKIIALGELFKSGALEFEET